MPFLSSNEVVVAYSGVHQAFQLAQAAQEAGLLERFYCSVFDAPGKWGRALGCLVGQELLINRRCSQLEPAVVSEIPWPFLKHRISARLGFSRRLWPWHEANAQFDGAVSRRLAGSASRLFVGVETCARDSMRAAKRSGMTCVLDCPQVHPDFLTQILADAAVDLKMPPPPPFDPPTLDARKREELAMADIVLVLSKVHSRTFLDAGFPAARLHEVPLWVDSQLWRPREEKDKGLPVRALRVLFVGSIGLRKGIPYLVRAVNACGPGVELTMVGVSEVGADRFISPSWSRIRKAGSKTKSELRLLYWESDVLVLPSLVDTFGFVALEAMACGLPVIVTENCGVPVPDDSWRVPIMDGDAIAARLQLYADNRELLRSDGERAAAFARQYTPERYRAGIRKLLGRLLDGTSPSSDSPMLS